MDRNLPDGHGLTRHDFGAVSQIGRMERHGGRWRGLLANSCRFKSDVKLGKCVLLALSGSEFEKRIVLPWFNFQTIGKTPIRFESCLVL
jgi:hypothetical protein